MPRHFADKTKQAANITSFAGFALPTSNTTYCPNQLFDVCLPHYSRGVVRIVAYILRKTLGWCDEQGRPQRERFCITYGEIEGEAGVSRDMIKSALEEAEAGYFIHCLRRPSAKGKGKPGVSGLYELRWDDRGEYIKDPKQFRGFFAGEGNRTYIPNQFFDHVVRHEALAMVKVVGSVIRYSIGFQNKWGHRRRNVALSLNHIKNYTKMADTKNVSTALKQALAANYILQVEKGYFDPRAGKTSKAAVYALRWAHLGLHEAAEWPIGQKLPVADMPTENRSEITHGIGQKLPAEDRSEITHGIEIKQRNKTNKQQPEAAASFEELKHEGFDEKMAQAMANRYDAGRISRQIDWIDRRNVKTSRLGMLRTAIEQDWPAPSGKKLRRLNFSPENSSGTSVSDVLSEVRKRFFREGDLNH